MRPRSLQNRHPRRAAGDAARVARRARSAADAREPDSPASPRQPCRHVRGDVRPAEGPARRTRRRRSPCSRPASSGTSPPPTARTSSSCGSHDDRMIECVLIQDEGRATACISTQVGCGMGCVFCASGLNGVVRNLTVGEIVEQLVRLRNLTDPTTTNPERAPRLTHIVVMGMGEPLANLDNLLAALAVAGDKNGLGIGAAARHDLDRRAAGEDSPARRARQAVPPRGVAARPERRAPHADRADQRQDRHPGHPRGGRRLLREDRPAGDLRVRRARRAERRAGRTRRNWPACSRAARPTST